MHTAISPRTNEDRRIASCQLLVSVRDAKEARLALESGVSWIDLKDPSRGALGTPDLKVAQQVADVLKEHTTISVALGELVDLELQHAVQLADSFPTLKIGLSNLKQGASFPLHEASKLRDLDQALRAKQASLVPVIYADWQSCNAPSPGEVTAVAVDLGCPFVLVDTFVKQGKRLLDHVTLTELRHWIQTLDSGGCRLILAGSIRLKDLSALKQLPIAAIGIRGGVCESRRDGAVCPRKLAHWLENFALA